MKDTTEQIKRTEKPFSIDVLTLVTGTTLAQLITIALAPIITRLYSADAFGLSALFASLVGTIAVIACLRYELAIMLPKTDEEAANVLALSLLIASIISLILVPTIWLFGDDLISLLNAPQLRPYLWLVPPMVFLSGSFSAVNYWNSRKREFGRLSRTQVARAATTSGTQLGAGFAGYLSGGALIAAGIIGQAVATSTLGYQAWRSDNKKLRSSITKERILIESKIYVDFPKIDIWSALINTFSLQIPIFILSAFFSTAIVGYYSLGMTVLMLPMSFIGSAISQVFFQRAAKSIHESKVALKTVVESTVGRLFIIGFFPMLLLSLVGAEAFTVVFGDAWTEAGIYAQILSFTVLVSFVTSPMTTLFTVQKKLRAFFIFNVIIMISRAVPLFWGGYFNNIYLGLAGLSLLGGIAYISMGCWIIQRTSASLTTILSIVSRPFFVGAIILLVIALGKFFFGLNPITLIIGGVMGALIYYGGLVAKLV